MIVFKYGERNAEQNGVGNFGMNYNDSHSICCDRKRIKRRLLVKRQRRMRSTNFKRILVDKA